MTIQVSPLKHTHINERDLEKAYEEQRYSQVGEASVSLEGNKSTQEGFYREMKKAQAKGALFPLEFFQIPVEAFGHFEFTCNPPGIPNQAFYRKDLTPTNSAAYRAFRKMMVASALAAALRINQAEEPSVFKYDVCTKCLAVVTKTAFKVARCALESHYITSNSIVLDKLTELARAACEAAKSSNVELANKTFRTAYTAIQQAGIRFNAGGIVHAAMDGAYGEVFKMA